MGQAIGSLLFLAMLSFVGWVVYSEVGGAAPAAQMSVDPVSGSFDDEVQLASYNADAVRDLDSVLEDALQNAERAEHLAAELEDASRKAYQAASRVGSLEGSNGAVPASRMTTVNAARSAEYAAVLMRDYADQMSARLRESGLLADDAANAAVAVAKVEQTQQDALRAAAKLEASRRELEMARANAYESQRDAAGMGMPQRQASVIEAVPMEDQIEEAGPDAIIVVPLEDDEGY
ncbi:MAG: hypothetical protein V2I43_18450 [Parvularcula sp.]|jgi:hypothetical protein|nr:hypothetical protein [Parvularcula sp.]